VWIRQDTVRWLPTVVVLAVVLVAGSRLIDLSVHHHAAAARETAAKDAIIYSARIEPLLQKLADQGRSTGDVGRPGLDTVRRHPRSLGIGAAGGQDFLDDEPTDKVLGPPGRDGHGQ